MIIERNFKNEFNINKIKLVYGRRKTGKSFYVQNFIKYNKFFFIYRDKTIKNIETNENWNYSELKRYIIENKDKQIVVDEFHRLDDDFLDFLHSQRLNNLIIITSSLHIAKKIISIKSPILGLVYPIEFSLIKPCEIINSLKDQEDAIEYSVFLREPSLIELYDKKETITEFLIKYYNFAKYWSIALFGEIFEDEDKKLTATYDAIIRAIAQGKNTTGEITSHLFQNNIISKETQGAVTSYLDNLLKMDILYKIEFYEKNKFVYKLSSAPLDFYFYIDSKYGVNISDKEITVAWQNKVSFYVEDLLIKIMCFKDGLTRTIYNKPLQEIDVVLKKFQKINTIGSVKWKDISKVSLKDVKKNLDIKNIDVKYKFLFVKHKKNKTVYEDISIYDYKDVFKFCK